MENDNILIKVVPELSSYIRLNRFLLTRTKGALCLLIVPLLFFPMEIISVVQGNAKQALICIIISIIWIILYPLLSIFLVRFRFKRKFYNDIKNIIYVINANGIEIKTDSCSKTVKWKQITKVYDTNYSFYIMQYNKESIIIQKKFITEKQDNMIRALFKDKLLKYCYECKIYKNKAIKFLSEADAVREEDLVGKVERSDDKNYDVTVKTKITRDKIKKLYNFSFFKGFNKWVVSGGFLINFFFALIGYVKRGFDGSISQFVNCIIWVPAMFFMMRIAAEKEFLSYKSYGKPIDVFYGFNNEGITEITNNSKETFKWSQIFTIYERKKYFYIYTNKMMDGFVISKAEFQQGELEAVKKIINSKLTKKQNRLKKEPIF